MVIHLLSALNLLLLLTCAAAPRIRTNEKRVSLSLLQNLAAMPLLAVGYLYTAHHMADPTIYPGLFFTETLFALFWLSMAYRLSYASATAAPETRLVPAVQLLAGAALAALALFFQHQPPAIEATAEALLADAPHGAISFQAIALLIMVLAAAWRLENFWRGLDPSTRWAYKFLIVGGFLASGALIWAASYRVTYLRISADHLTLLAVIILLAWLLIAYAVVRHRLLNRKMFVSRKIIYTFVAPTIFAVYLLALGIISLIMRLFGLSLPFVLQWTALALGLTAIGLFLVSPNLRRKIQFFISTHFYINKYEYRDEWLALSSRLQNAATETEVVSALHEVLKNSLYADRIAIWTGDHTSGYSLTAGRLSEQPPDPTQDIRPDDPMMPYLLNHPYYYEETKTVADHHALAAGNSAFLKKTGLVLLVPLNAADQLTGIIGLGPEFTGGRYGHDDFDLLTALGTQTASALMATRMAEKLAEARERQAWHRLSAFVLHDIKNAASMLSLVRANAPANIHDPAFQTDMLEAIDDALARMGKVQQRLDMLKEEIEPRWTRLDLHTFLHQRTRDIGKHLSDMTIHLQCPPDLQLRTDPQLLSRILENLLLNAHEACADMPSVVHITAEPDFARHLITLTIIDNGPGIPPNLLPEALFAPLKTTKPSGSGIGLWQVKQLVTSLGGTIQAGNTSTHNAQFTIKMPSSSAKQVNFSDTAPHRFPLPKNGN